MTACAILLPCLLPVLGGFGLPLSVPPLPETPLLASVAPEHCLFYLSAAGITPPDAQSRNQTEQLLAEPELQKIYTVIEAAIQANLTKAADAHQLPLGMSAEEGIEFLKLLLTRPLAIWISDVQKDTGRPMPRGAVVIHCGKALEDIRARLEQIAQSFPPQSRETFEFDGAKWQSFKPQPGVNIVWGFKYSYLVVALGEGEMQAAIGRARGKPPAWLAKIREDLPIQRVSTIAYVNLKAIRETFLPQAPPQTAMVFGALGLDNVDALCSVTGLNEKACLQRMLLSFDGEPRGVMRFASVAPLAAADLAPVPADAVVTLAGKIQPLGLFNAYLEMLGKADSHVAESARRGIAQVETMTGLKLRTDILKPLGDSFAVFATPGPLGIPSATAVVQLKDPVQAAKTYDRLIVLLETSSKMAENQPSLPTLVKQTVAGKTICSVTAASGAVSFCITDKELVVAASSKDVEAYLTRPAAPKSLAQAPDVAAALQGEAGPTAMLYCDVPQIFDKVYPMLPMAAMMFQQQGINLDVSLLPPAEVIRRHLTPVVATVRQTKAGIEIAEQYPAPGVNIISNAPMWAGLLLPAVQAAREASRRMQSQNNLKQLGLAILVYEHAHGSFPPAYTTGKDGKPLLSWRVHILPYMDQDALYKQFHLDEPWDSEHNKALVAQMPAAYKQPKSAVAGEGKANYLTVRGEKTVFPGDKGVTMTDIRDGTSSTIMTVEVPDENAVIWTKPDDFQYDENNPLKGLTGLWPGGFNAGFADGSVRFLSLTIGPKTLAALFTRNGGEAIDPSMFGP